MKKLVLVLSAAMVLQFTGCNGNNEKVKDSDAGEGLPTEKVMAFNNTPEKTETASGSVHITKAGFLEKIMDYETNKDKWVYKGDKPCIVDFYASWCGPCKIASPILDELAVEYADKIYVYKVNTEKERELSSVFGIQSIPAFLLVPMEGQPSMSAGIGRTKEETREMFVNIIENFLLKKAE